ncbi:MAG TPA: glycosyltransferase family 9 protein [Steroidobacteraceae bacterium]|nr:glycosyltransferase family 9 protein [Steroidobacteraceae bacterium]
MMPRPSLRDALKGLRRRSRSLFSQALTTVAGTRRYATALAPESVSSVLICRLNGRIGNTMFLTPLIRELHELLPDAAIDLAIGYRAGSELLGALPGVRRVIVFPHRSPLRIGRYVAALREVRKERYALAIDPIPESTSGHALLSLARARYRLGFSGPGQWAPLTHAVPVPGEVAHRALQPLYLACRIFGAAWPPPRQELFLALSPEELAAGQALIAQAIGPGPQPGRDVVGFFAHATHRKALGREWWLAFWEAYLALEPRAIPVEFLPSPATAPIRADIIGIHVPSTRALAAAIASTRLFVSADAGPMHLASATPVATIGLFKVTDPALFGPLKPVDRVIDIVRHSPAEAAEICHRAWLAQ